MIIESLIAQPNKIYNLLKLYKLYMDKMHDRWQIVTKSSCYKVHRLFTSKGNDAEKCC